MGKERVQHLCSPSVSSWQVIGELYTNSYLEKPEKYTYENEIVLFLTWEGLP